MKQRQIIDVSNKNIEVLSYNFKTSKNEFNKVLKLVRKPNSKIYIFKTEKDTLEFTGDHEIYVKMSTDLEGGFFEISHCFKMLKKYPNLLVKEQNGNWSNFTITKTDIEKPIFDIEVDKVHNFYTGNILSHNTMFGDPRTTQGGHALKFYTDVRIEVSKTLAKEGTDAYGNITKIKAIKNKMAPPFKSVDFEIVFGVGIDRIGEIIQIGNDFEILRKYGKNITYGETKYLVEEFRTLLEDNEEFFDKLRQDIIDAINSIEKEVANEINEIENEDFIQEISAGSTEA